VQSALGTPVSGDSAPSIGAKLTRWLARPQTYRWLAGLAVGLILAATLASISAGGLSQLPPPLNLRGTTPDSRPVGTNGLEFVPAPVIDLGPTTTSSPSTTSDSSTPPIGGSTDSPAAVPSTSAASADSPDQPIEDDSADSPDQPIEDDSADSPDQPVEDDSADSPDDPDD